MSMLAPFMVLPFLGLGKSYNASKFTARGEATARFSGTTAWDRMLAQDNAPIAYFVEIEPYVLADRS